MDGRRLSDGADAGAGEARQAERADDPGTGRRGGAEGPTLDAQRVRQGEIILKSRATRTIFVAGLVGIVVLALVLAIAGMGR